MRKIEQCNENPVDDLLIRISEYVCPFFHKTGHSANMITLYSLVTGIMALDGMYYYDFTKFAIWWTVSYFFDNLDGHYARKYQMVTRLGDLFDHIKDSTLWIATFAILYRRYEVPYYIIGLFVFFGIFCAKHIGCQQIHYKIKDKHEGASETLDMYIRLCKDPAAIYWTKYFGGGTINTMLVITMWYLMENYRVFEVNV